MPTARYFEPPRDGPAVENTLLVSVPAEYIPAALSALESRKDRVFWKTDGDFSNGLQGILTTQWGLLMDIGTQLLESNNRIFMLLDSFINGNQYVLTPEGAAPPLPIVPETESTAGNAGRAHLARLWQLAENAQAGRTFDAGAGIEGSPVLGTEGAWAARLLALQGEIPGGWFGIGAKPTQLVDLLKAGRLNTPAERNAAKEALDGLDTVLDVGTDLGTFLKGLLTSAAELGTDGGVILTNLVTSTAMLRLMQRQIKSTDGGELTGGGPENNLLYYARASGYNASKEVSSGQQLENIYERLGQLGGLLGELGGSGPGLNARLEALQVQLSALARIDDSGNPVAGTVLKAIEALIECICEGVSGAPTPPPEFPPYVLGECNPEFVLQAQGTFTFDANGNGNPIVTRTTNASIVTQIVPGDGVYVDGNIQVVRGGVAGPRQICITVAAPVGGTVPALTAQLFPVRVPDGSGASANARDTTGLDLGGSVTIEAVDGQDFPIGYYITIATAAGAPVPAGTYKLYIAAGPVG